MRGPFPPDASASGGNAVVLSPHQAAESDHEEDVHGHGQRGDVGDVCHRPGQRCHQRHAWGPAFVLAHQVPQGWPRPDSTVHFVREGVEGAVAQAKEAAGDLAVAVHGADTIQQLWNAGLLDETAVDVAAVLHLRYPVLTP